MTNPVDDETLKELVRSIMQSGYYDYRSDDYDQELEKNMQAVADWHSQGVGEARLDEASRVYWGEKSGGSSVICSTNDAGEEVYLYDRVFELEQRVKGANHE